MAEHTSTRTARRTTPQPLAQAARTTRTTRSQSRDISDSEDARNGNKARRRGMQADNVQNHADPRKSKGNRGKMGNESRALQDLSMVAEESSVAYPELQLDGEDQGNEEYELIESTQAREQVNPQSKSPGGVSAFSGTTARTSNSAQDLSDLSMELMLDALVDLSSASTKMLSFLILSDISEASIMVHMDQLQTKNSPANRNLTRLAQSLSAQKDIYGSGPYIALQEVLYSLVGDNHKSSDQAGPWRPDALLYKANLAVLAADILSRPWRTRDAQSVEELDRIFPGSFTEGLATSRRPLAGYTELWNETFQLALEIRTQYAIMRLASQASQPYFEPDTVLLEVFYQNDNTLRGWGVVGLRFEDLKSEARDTILSRLETIRGAFATSEDDSIASITSVRSLFPWTTLVPQVVSWIDLRSKELNHQISVRQGPDGILETLKEEIERARLTRSARHDGINDGNDPPIILEFEQPSEAVDLAFEPPHAFKKGPKSIVLKQGQFSSNSPKARGAVTAMKRIEALHKAAIVPKQLPQQQDSQRDSDVKVTATAGSSAHATTSRSSTDESAISSTAPAKILSRKKDQAPQNDEWQPQVEVEDLLLPESEEILRQKASQAFALNVQQQAESNKENIEIPMSQPGPQAESDQRRRYIDRQKNAHRLEEFDESQELARNNQPSQMPDPSQDDGFQTQDGPADIAQRRSVKPAAKRSAPQPREAQRSSPKRPRLPEVGRLDGVQAVRHRMDDEPSRSPIEGYRAANSTAKETHAFQPKPPQTRRPWSEDETEALLGLIEKHGTSWALLLETDKTKNGGPGLLQSRNQVNLKDKARNMKLDYLKSSNMLPLNFDRISISKIQKDALVGLHIDYDPETGRRKDAPLDVSSDSDSR